MLDCGPRGSPASLASLASLAGGLSSQGAHQGGSFGLVVFQPSNGGALASGAPLGQPFHLGRPSTLRAPSCATSIAHGPEMNNININNNDDIRRGENGDN